MFNDLDDLFDLIMLNDRDCVIYDIKEWMNEYLYVRFRAFIESSKKLKNIDNMSSKEIFNVLAEIYYEYGVSFFQFACEKLEDELDEDI